MKHLKYILIALLIGSSAYAVNRLQDRDFATSAEITGAGGSVSQLLNTSKIYDNVNAQVLNTTIAAKATNPMTTAEDLIKGGVSGAPARLAVGSNGQCLTISGGVVGWGACGTSSPLTTKGDLYTYDTGNQRLAVGTDGQVLSANSAQATGLEWITPASGGDFSSNTATSVDSEVVLFSGTGGKTGKRATGTGVCHLTSGVLSVGNVALASEVSGTLPNGNTTADSANTASAIVARDGSGNFSAGTITAALSGNASTSTALAANPADCGAGTKAISIAANGDLTCSAVSLTADVSGVMPLANGGTNKNMTAVNGGVVWTDADSMEVIAAGTSGQILQSNGAAAPSWVNPAATTAVTKSVNQTAHGFAVQDIVYYTGSAWAKAKADADSTSEAIGMVSAVADADNFTVTYSGEVTGLSGLTSGTTYYLSAATAGLATATAPTAAGHISKPVGVALSTTVMRLFDSSRGAVIGGASSSGGIFSSIKWVGVSSCNWTRTSNATWASFSADSDCTTPTGGSIVGSGIAAPATKIPGFVISSADTTPNTYYKVIVTGNLGPNGSVSSPCAVRLTDGTDVSQVVPILGSNTGIGNNATAVFYIHLSTSGSRTLELQMTGVSTNNQCDILARTADFEELTFFIEKVTAGGI